MKYKNFNKVFCWCKWAIILLFICVMFNETSAQNDRWINYDGTLRPYWKIGKNAGEIRWSNASTLYYLKYNKIGGGVDSTYFVYTKNPITVFIDAPLDSTKMLYGNMKWKAAPTGVDTSKAYTLTNTWWFKRAIDIDTLGLGTGDITQVNGTLYMNGYFRLPSSGSVNGTIWYESGNNGVWYQTALGARKMLSMYSSKVMPDEVYFGNNVRFDSTVTFTNWLNFGTSGQFFVPVKSGSLSYAGTMRYYNNKYYGLDGSGEFEFIKSTGNQTISGIKDFTGTVQILGELALAGTGTKLLNALNGYLILPFNSSTYHGSIWFDGTDLKVYYGGTTNSYVNTARTLTINGTSYNLSANRSWTVGDVIAPASNTDDYIPLWNGTNTKTLKNGLAYTSLATPGTVVTRNGSGNSYFNKVFASNSVETPFISLTTGSARGYIEFLGSTTAAYLYSPAAIPSGYSFDIYLPDGSGTLVLNSTSINTSGSLTGGGNLSSSRTLSLVNDNASPGNLKYYGTNNSGTKGFFDLPSGGSGTVTSVGLSAPAGFSVSGSPVTTSGTLALSFASGYSLPTDASQSNWNTAYGWGNHASAGYATASNSMTFTNKTWNGNTIGIAYGGTNATSFSTGNGLVYYDGTRLVTTTVTAGDLYQSGLFNPTYGELYDNVATSTISTNGSSYVKWTGSSVGECSGVTGNTTNDNLTINSGRGGVFKVSYSVTFKVSATGDYYWTTNINGSALSKNRQRIYAGSTNVDYTVSSSAIVSLSSSDTIDLGCYAASATVTVSYANLNIVKISN